jgi:hypothetical protein
VAALFVTHGIFFVFALVAPPCPEVGRAFTGGIFVFADPIAKEESTAATLKGSSTNAIATPVRRM